MLDLVLLGIVQHRLFEQVSNVSVLFDQFVHLKTLIYLLLAHPIQGHQSLRSWAQKFQ
jgi:hypothetical protein